MTGPELLAFRNSLNLSQEAFAKRLGVTSVHVCRMERGHKAVGDAVLRGVALMKILGKLDGRPSALAAELREIAEEGLTS